MKTVNDIRSEFLSFFKGKGHTVVESSPLVPQNDPTLMFVNSGMVQFKDVFTGKDKRPYTRATTSQKCVRAGGKHNDLDNVGYTARHHTFFEMLGNFSFGDYFKDDAIAFAWELVTKNFALPAEKLCVTVHSSDEEAAAIWKKVSGLADEKIIRIPTDDNFWRMGDTGPCGPCTEIFYDHGDHIWGGPPGSPEEDGDRFIEIWNNVFMQYEQVDADTRIDLPAQSVDTGMGLERIAATLMGSHDNYAIDIMRSLIEHCADLTGVDPDGDRGASHRVIADHIRCSAFLMADGVMPSNEGRGYVLRRIMRRGMRHAHLLGANEPLMYKLFPTLLDKMGQAYPELGRAESLIVGTLKSEEERFKVTLDRGLKILEEETEKVASGKKFPGDVAFKLYDTYGFPLDLTQDALKSQNIEVDEDGFNTCMEEQKAKARAAWSGSGDAATEKIWYDILDDFGPTEFLGYEVESAEGKVLAIVKKQRCHPVGETAQPSNLNERDPHASREAAHDSGFPQPERAGARRGDDFEWVRVDTLAEGEEGYIITNQTPFYAESGGQVGDSGQMLLVNAQNDAKPQDITQDEMLETERLKLKIITQDEMDAVFETMNYKNTAETISFMRWPMTIDQAQDWVDRSEKGKYCFVAYDKKTGKPAGCISVHPEDDEQAELGYWVSEPFQGRGYAREMVGAIIAFAFNTLHLKGLWATTRVDNDISTHILEQSGFFYEGTRNMPKRVPGGMRMSKVFRLKNAVTVTDTKKFISSIYAHYVKLNSEQIKVGDAVRMEVDHDRRSAIRANHSATHLMHEALRRVLGDHVAQKGSLQDDARTRFDISHPKAIKPEEIARVEEIVAAEIAADTPVTTRLMGLDEARETGAMALFGEKYDSEVRVVAMGSKESEREFSIELCGGTHVKNTGQIGPFKIISESALSAGVRRLEAITGEAVKAYETRREEEAKATLDKILHINTQLESDYIKLGGKKDAIEGFLKFGGTDAKLSDEEFNDIMHDQLRKKKFLEKQISDLRRAQAAESAASSGDDIKEIGGVKFIGKVLEDFPPQDLKPMADDLKKKLGSGVIALVATNDGKASIVVAVTDDLTEKLNAVDLVKCGAEKLGGKGGGGRPDMAQAGGPDASAANDAVQGIEAAMAG